MANNLIHFIDTIKSQLINIPIVPGQCIYCTDTGESYFDTNDSIRIQLSDIIYLELESDKPIAPISTKLYYVKETNSLYKYNGVWTIINNTIELISTLPVITELTPYTLIQNGKKIAPVTTSNAVYRTDSSTVENALNSIENRINDGLIVTLATEADRKALTDVKDKELYLVDETSTLYQYINGKWKIVSIGKFSPVTTSSTDGITYSLTLSQYELEIGAVTTIVFNMTNTSSHITLNINDKGAIPVKINNIDPQAGQIKINMYGIIFYDGEYYQLFATNSNMIKKTIMITNHLAATDDSQKIFTIPVPYANYLNDGYNFILYIGSVLFDNTRYTVDKDTGILTFVSDEVGINKGRILTFVFIYDDIAVNNLKLGNIQQRTFTATDNQTTFQFTDLTYEPGLNEVSCYIDGLKQENSIFTEPNNNTIIFNTGITAGKKVMFEVGRVIVNDKIQQLMTSGSDMINILNDLSDTINNNSTIFNMIWNECSYSEYWSKDTNFAFGLQYAKDAIKNVFLQGSIQRTDSPLTGEVILTLPAEYRPGKNMYIQLLDLTQANNTILCSLETNGVLKTAGDIESFIGTHIFAIDTTFKAEN